jgi:hypothetical protein
MGFPIDDRGDAVALMLPLDVGTFSTLRNAEGNSPMTANSYQKKGYWVDLIGIEPMTSSMPSRFDQSFPRKGSRRGAGATLKP